LKFEIVDISRHPPPVTRHTLHSRQIKTGVFALEALNALATTYFFYYAYFFMRDAFGFGALQNLILAAATGFVYMFAAIFGGRFGQKHGYFCSLKIGFVILGLSIGAGMFLNTAAGLVMIIVLGNIGMCFTWPALQSIISGNESRVRLQSLTGIYNFTWAAGSAFAYFIGGALMQKLGRQSMFYLPAGIHGLQLIIAFWLEAKATRGQSAVAVQPEPDSAVQETLSVAPTNAKQFLTMAWLANPFAYVAINTIIAVMPALALKLHLPVEWAGFLCSTWLIVRAASFVFLRWWPDWHYRFGLLLGAYAAMVAGFAGVLLAPNIEVLVIAQIIFGLALSLIYYSSLFYSMDVGEASGDHAGFHEGMIGLGTGGGPAIGAAALYFFPNAQNAGVAAVTGLLLVGLIGLIRLRIKR
jgi:MFS family permease